MKWGNKRKVPEVWGGIECSISRVNDSFTDQLAAAGYYERSNDLDTIIDLGIKTIRFPVLWEKHQPFLSGPIDFTWAASQLNTLRKNKVEPIVGLLHHGSGPAFTSLLDDDMPYLFADYAEQVAIKFPWIKYYCPVNEPLTTARFSGLYGLWYPHKKNDTSFIKILLNELKAVVLAMQAIRKINPKAQLVQTEDLGKTYSTDLLAYQSDFENKRRWLTYDILCGQVNTAHPLWDYLLRTGATENELEFFIRNPCQPDMLGVNYYITSERFLDDDLAAYPTEYHGGNEIHQYADVAAIRVNMTQESGAKILIRELWERYKIPVAITEVHLNCTREEQLRWIKKMYSIACELNNEGVSILGVTIWSLLGAFGWDQLLTAAPGRYESGAFDISAGYARPTAVAFLIKKLMKTRQNICDGLEDQDGWWMSDQRFLVKTEMALSQQSKAGRPIMILGRSGRAGHGFVKGCVVRNLQYIAIGREADITSSSSLEKVIAEHRPWAIINATGYVDIETAEVEKISCEMINTLGAQKLAIICEREKIKLLHISTDMVFDGSNEQPYNETAIVSPINVYGNSKARAENFVSNVNPSALIIRTSSLFSADDQRNFVQDTLHKLQQGRPVFAGHEIISLTYMAHFVTAALDLLIDDARGIFHVVNNGAISWYELAKKIARFDGLDDSLIKTKQPGIARLPANAALVSIKYNMMPSLDEGLHAFFAHQLVTV